MAVKITFSQSSWTSSLTALYLDTSTAKCYSDSACTIEINSVPVPTRTSTTATSGYKFLGYWSTNAVTGIQYISDDGTILDTLRALTAAKTIYCPSIVYSYRITLNNNGGSGGDGKIWRIKTPTTSDFFFAEEYCATAVSSVTPPTREHYTFNGYYNSSSATSPGNQYIDADGNILSSLSELSATYKTIYANWTGDPYTLTLDPNGGRVVPVSLSVAYGSQIGTIPTPTRSGYIRSGWNIGSTSISSSTVWNYTENKTAVAQWAKMRATLTFVPNGGTCSTESKSVTFASAIGDLPTPSRPGWGFLGWYIGTTKLETTTLWIYDDDRTAIAEWNTPFGDVVDYFGLESTRLIAEYSDSGDTHQLVCAYNATSETPTTETSGIWRNPRVTYRVVGYMTLNVTLGDSWTGNSSVSGYMISAVEIHTAVGEAPTVTVSAVANEGTDAVQTYDVSVELSPRHRPQNLLSAISGGGELQELTLVASGDPVVLAENGMPCASDMTHGRIVVTAKTAAYNRESAPTAGTNFTKTAEPQSNSGLGYKTFTVNVRKELT